MTTTYIPTRVGDGEIGVGCRLEILLIPGETTNVATTKVAMLMRSESGVRTWSLYLLPYKTEIWNKTNARTLQEASTLSPPDGLYPAVFCPVEP